MGNIKLIEALKYQSKGHKFLDFSLIFGALKSWVDPSLLRPNIYWVMFMHCCDTHEYVGLRAARL